MKKTPDMQSCPPVLTTPTENTPGAVLARTATCARLVLRTVAVPQKETFRSAIGVRAERRALIVEWHRADGACGYGEFSGRTDPFFNGEFLTGAVDVLNHHMAPRLPREAALGHYLDLADKLRGWPFARAALTDALFDAGRRRGEPDLVDTRAPLQETIPAGISLGLFPSPEEAVNRVRAALDRGFRRIKLKVTPTMDLAVPRAVREAFPDAALLFDANGSGGDDAMPFFRALADLSPSAIEQPTLPGRWDLLKRMRDEVPDLRICLDEDAVHADVVEGALALGLADEINLKPGRVGGQRESLRLLERAAAHDKPVWVGGMFETAIGRYQNIRYAALLPKSPAHDLSPSDRYFDRDLSPTPPAMSADGRVTPSPGPVEVDEDAMTLFEIERVEVAPGETA